MGIELFAAVTGCLVGIVSLLKPLYLTLSRIDKVEARLESIERRLDGFSRCE